VFFPNLARAGLELRNTVPGGFASNDYGFWKCAQFQQNQNQQQ